ncbi:hypothetical protein K3495_g8143 [Podosphaera aphanis]|nr:hypothetical protein K3495_g8143 [Podosphaera aphanis]
MDSPSIRLIEEGKSSEFTPEERQEIRERKRRSAMAKRKLMAQPDFNSYNNDKTKEENPLKILLEQENQDEVNKQI